MGTKLELLGKVVALLDYSLMPLKATYRKNNRSYIWQISKGFSGSIGLNTIMLGNGELLGINPIIGVIDHEIEKILDQFASSTRRAPSPTIATPLGYLTPEARYIEWNFCSNEQFNLDDEVAEMSNSILRYGIPFVEAHASSEALTSDLERLSFTFRESAIYRLPVAYVASRRVEEARVFVEKELQLLDGRRDIAAEDYRVFAQNLLVETQN